MNKEEKINEYFNALFSKRYQKYNLLFNNLEVLSKSQLFSLCPRLLGMENYSQNRLF